MGFATGPIAATWSMALRRSVTHHLPLLTEPVTAPTLTSQPKRDRFHAPLNIMGRSIWVFPTMGAMMSPLLSPLAPHSRTTCISHADHAPSWWWATKPPIQPKYARQCTWSTEIGLLTMVHPVNCKSTDKRVPLAHTRWIFPNCLKARRKFWNRRLIARTLSMA